MRWEKLEGVTYEGEGYFGPGKLWGHTCNAVKGGKLVYVFGGCGQGPVHSNKVHVFDTERRKWFQPDIKSAPPCGRDSHTCTAIGNYLYVFGGTDGIKTFEDLHILDISSHTWTSPNVRGEGPGAREGHSAVSVGKRIFIYGGRKSSESAEELMYKDVYILNTETLVWSCPMTSGITPPARVNHTCSLWKNNMIVIGGEDEQDYASDVYIFNTDTHAWSELNTSGVKFLPRGGHTTIRSEKNLLIFGGYTNDSDLLEDFLMLDVETCLWTKVTATGQRPIARFAASADSLAPIYSGIQVLIGGCARKLDALDDMYYLHTELASGRGQEGSMLVDVPMRTQLNLKYNDQHFPVPVHDQPWLTYKPDAVSCQPIPVSVYSQPSLQNVPLHVSQHLQGAKSFQAKVTESLTDGYAIETVIDGKLLRGVLFTSRPSFSGTCYETNSRKKKGDESGDVHKQKLNVINHIQLDDVPENEMKRFKLDISVAGISKIPVRTETSHSHEVSEKLNLPITSDFRVEDGINYEPNLKFKETESASSDDRLTVSLNQGNQLLTMQSGSKSN